MFAIRLKILSIKRSVQCPSPIPHWHCLKPSRANHKDPHKLLRRWVFQHIIRLKCSVSKWSHILLSITECRHVLIITITALWLSSLQCYCIQWCTSQYLQPRCSTRIVSKSQLFHLFQAAINAPNIALKVLVTYFGAEVKLNWCPTELQRVPADAEWCSLQNSFPAFLPSISCLPRPEN